MERKPPLPMTPFDLMISTDSMQMMKLMLPYLPPSSQKLFAIYIKFQELTHTMNYFNSFHTGLRNASGRGTPDLTSILDDIRPYMNEKDAGALEQMMNMLHMMEMMKEMGAMDGLFGGGGDDGSGNSAGNSGGFAGMDPMSMMMNMLSPEQQEMFESYNDIFQNMEQDNKNSVKGADTDGSELDGSSGAEGHGSPEAGAD